ncbi:spike base protein, RCAP_Rcc01079 family [Burkholderia sp. 22313]|uniref:spike base protein, RCAP_Rcc01079 family n=1 Tax=Burkholderia sp. 22313 TaxID=3453908 RepID=UPI003F82A02C
MGIIDRFKFATITLTSSAVRFYQIAPSDDEDLPDRPRGVFVGEAGDVMLIGDNNEPVPFRNCYAGQVLPVRPIRVLKTGTTASGLVALV